MCSAESPEAMPTFPPDEPRDVREIKREGPIVTALAGWLLGVPIIKVAYILVAPGDATQEIGEVIQRALVGSGPLLFATMLIVILIGMESIKGYSAMFSIALILWGATFLANLLAEYGLSIDVERVPFKGQPHAILFGQAKNYIRAYGVSTALAAVILGGWTGYRIVRYRRKDIGG